jgi:hypothetical protein
VRRRLIAALVIAAMSMLRSSNREKHAPENFLMQ